MTPGQETTDRCAYCGDLLPPSDLARHEADCDGPAGRKATACGTRPDHLWEVAGGEGWKCLYCSRLTFDADEVRAGREAAGRERDLPGWLQAVIAVPVVMAVATIVLMFVGPRGAWPLW